MEHLFTSANVWILDSDRETIHLALVQAGYSEKLATLFSGPKLRTDFERWEVFVHTDWSHWDYSEYDQDLGCRYGIQVVIENSCAETRARLEDEVRAIDEVFCENMKPLRAPRISRLQLPLSDHPYFWETGTLHPEDELL